MSEFNKRRSKALIRLLSRLAGVFALVFVAFFAVHGAWDMYQKFTISAQGDEISQKELSGLEVQQAKVTASLSELDSARGQEAQMRERYGVAKPGEGEIEIVRDATSSQTEAAPSSNIFIRIWRAVFVW